MGRRRTLINDFGANWTTERVSAKKKMRRWPTNMIVIRIIIRFHRSCVINLIMNIAIIRIVTSEPLYLISYILFPDFFLILSVFLVFTLVSFFYVSSRIFFRSSLIFFSCFFSVYQVLYSVIRCKRDSKKKKKEKNVMCGVSDVIAVKSNFASPSTKKKYGLAGLHFCLRFRKFTRRNALEISMIVRDRSDNASANYVTSCCF